MIVSPVAGLCFSLFAAGRFIHRHKGFGCWNIAHWRVIIPWRLAFGRGFHPIEREIVERTSIAAQSCRATKIINRRLAHHFIHRDRFIRAGGFRSPQIMRNVGVDFGMVFRWHHLALVKKAFGKVSGFVVLVPIKTGGDIEVLRFFQTKRVDVLNLDEEADQRLFAITANAKFMGLFDDINEIAADTCETNFLSFRALRLNQQ